MMRRAGRGRGRGAPSLVRAPKRAPAGFGGASSSSSSDEDDGSTGKLASPVASTDVQASGLSQPTTSVGNKRPRRIFRPADASDPFLNHLKQRKEDQPNGPEPTPPLELISGPKKGSFDQGDPSTTNLFVGNLNPKTDEAALQLTFGRYGPVGSVKIMWPRTEEEFERGYNSGFVSFVDRGDAEAAFQGLHETKIDGHVVRLAWGKAMRRVRSPLPPLPGQTYGGSAAKEPFEKDEAYLKANVELPRILVQPPLDLRLRRDIHRLARETAAVQNTQDPSANAAQEDRVRNFLSTCDSEDATYYQWRLYSLMHGDSETRWRTAPLALVDSGPLWDPPPCAHPMNNPPRMQAQTKKNTMADTPPLDPAAAAELERLLDGLEPSRASIAVAMVFCLDHARCAGDVALRVWTRIEGLAGANAPPQAGLALLFLVSDVLHNSANVGVAGASAYRTLFAQAVEPGFTALGAWRRSLPGRMAAHSVAASIAGILDTWSASRVFGADVLARIRTDAIGGYDSHALQSDAAVEST